jgi:hypothetical protein
VRLSGAPCESENFKTIGLVSSLGCVRNDRSGPPRYRGEKLCRRNQTSRSGASRPGSSKEVRGRSGWFVHVQLVESNFRFTAPDPHIYS